MYDPMMIPFHYLKSFPHMIHKNLYLSEDILQYPSNKLIIIK